MAAGRQRQRRGDEEGEGKGDQKRDDRNQAGNRLARWDMTGRLPASHSITIRAVRATHAGRRPVGLVALLVGAETHPVHLAAGLAHRRDLRLPEGAQPRAQPVGILVALEGAGLDVDAGARPGRAGGGGASIGGKAATSTGAGGGGIGSGGGVLCARGFCGGGFCAAAISSGTAGGACPATSASRSCRLSSPISWTRTLAVPRALEAEELRGATRDVDDAAAHERAAVVDPQDQRAPVLEVGDPHQGSASAASGARPSASSCRRARRWPCCGRGNSCPWPRRRRTRRCRSRVAVILGGIVPDTVDLVGIADAVSRPAASAFPGHRLGAQPDQASAVPCSRPKATTAAAASATGQRPTRVWGVRERQPWRRSDPQGIPTAQSRS